MQMMRQTPARIGERYSSARFLGLWVEERMRKPLYQPRIAPRQWWGMVNNWLWWLKRD